MRALCCSIKKKQDNFLIELPHMTFAHSVRPEESGLYAAIQGQYYKSFLTRENKICPFCWYSSPVISLVKFKQCSYTPPRVYDAHCREEFTFLRNASNYYVFAVSQKFLKKISLYKLLLYIIPIKGPNSCLNVTTEKIMCADCRSMSCTLLILPLIKNCLINQNMKSIINSKFLLLLLADSKELYQDAKAQLLQVHKTQLVLKDTLTFPQYCTTFYCNKNNQMHLIAIYYHVGTH